MRLAKLHNSLQACKALCRDFKVNAETLFDKIEYIQI